MIDSTSIALILQLRAKLQPDEKIIFIGDAATIGKKTKLELWLDKLKEKING